MEEDKYTRQIGVVGEAGQERIQQSVVAIYCLDSAALEIAKNLLLIGIKELLLCDSSNFQLNDLSTNFCIRELGEKVIGKERVEICASQLRKYKNEDTRIRCFRSKEEMFGSNIKIDMLVGCSNDVEKNLEISAECREKQIPVANAMSGGLHAYFAFDYGDNHFYYDTPDRYEFIVKNISSSISLSSPTSSSIPSSSSDNNNISDNNESNIEISSPTTPPPSSSSPLINADSSVDNHIISTYYASNNSIDNNDATKNVETIGYTIQLEIGEGGAFRYMVDDEVEFFILNGESFKEKFVIKEVDREMNSFSIEPSRSLPYFEDYQNNGKLFVRYYNGRKQVEHQELKSRIYQKYIDSQEEMNYLNERAWLLIIALKALSIFNESYHSFPKPRDPSHQKLYLEIVSRVFQDFSNHLPSPHSVPLFNTNDDVDNINNNNDDKDGDKMEEKRITMSEEELKIFQMIGNLSYCASYPMIAITGGFVTTEIIKALTHQFAPCNQIYSITELFDYFIPDLTAHDCTPDNDYLYSNIIYNFGKDYLKALQEAKILLVGAGALGCEYLKNVGMMGFSVPSSSSPSSFIHVVDNDLISYSNTTRQLFFRKKDQNKEKSRKACKRVRKEINKDIQLFAHSEKLNYQTISSFGGDPLLSQIDLFVSAVDNIQSREFLEIMSKMNQKTMIDGGTQGFFGSQLNFIPFITEEYHQFSDSNNNNRATNCTPKVILTSTTDVIQNSKICFEDCISQIRKILPKCHTEDNNYIYNNNDDNNCKSYERSDNDNINRDEFHGVASQLFNKLFVDNIEKLIEKQAKVSQQLSIVPLNIDQSSYDRLFSNFEENLFYLYENFCKREVKSYRFDKDNSIHMKLISCLSEAFALCYHLSIPSKTEILTQAGEMIPAIISTTAIISGFMSLNSMQAINKREMTNIGCERDLIFFHSPLALTKERQVIHRFSKPLTMNVTKSDVIHSIPSKYPLNSFRVLSSSILEEIITAKTNLSESFLQPLCDRLNLGLMKHILVELNYQFLNLETRRLYTERKYLICTLPEELYHTSLLPFASNNYLQLLTANEQLFSFKKSSLSQQKIISSLTNQIANYQETIQVKNDELNNSKLQHSHALSSFRSLSKSHEDLQQSFEKRNQQMEQKIEENNNLLSEKNNTIKEYENEINNLRDQLINLKEECSILSTKHNNFVSQSYSQQKSISSLEFTNQSQQKTIASQQQSISSQQSLISSLKEMSQSQQEKIISHLHTNSKLEVENKSQKITNQSQSQLLTKIQEEFKNSQLLIEDRDQLISKLRKQISVEKRNCAIRSEELSNAKKTIDSQHHELLQVSQNLQISLQSYSLLQRQFENYFTQLNNRLNNQIDQFNYFEDHFSSYIPFSKRATPFSSPTQSPSLSIPVLSPSENYHTLSNNNQYTEEEMTNKLIPKKIVKYEPLKGLTNIGNTCYLASAIQLMYCAHIFSGSKIYSFSPVSLSKNQFLRSLNNLFNNNNNNNYSNNQWDTFVTQFYKACNFVASKQDDSARAFETIMKYITPYLSDESKSLVLLRNQINQIVGCDNCSVYEKSNRETSYYQYSGPDSSSSVNFSEEFDNQFNQVQFECYCGKMCKQTTYFQQLPPFLFVVSNIPTSFIPNTRQLSLKSLNPSQNHIYEPIGYSIHSGTLNSGHYVTYSYDPSNNNNNNNRNNRNTTSKVNNNNNLENYYECNDTKITLNSKWPFSRNTGHCQLTLFRRVE